jgi:peroxiredoxin Q/BCP
MLLPRISRILQSLIVGSVLATTSPLWSAPVYRDPDAALARAYEIPDGYTFHGEQVHFPALLILDPDGREVFRKVGKDNTDRVSPSQLATALKELKKSR